MSQPPNIGDEILIPLFDPQNGILTIKWKQDMMDRSNTYYQVVADNITTGDTFILFIASEYYNASQQANPKHISRIGELIEGEGYKVTIDSNFQYGQKNAKGEMRFLVYHDKERKPYQHRFIETALGSDQLKKVQEIANTLGIPILSRTVDTIASILKHFVGDYLHTY